MDERRYMRRYTLRDFLRHARAFAFKAFLPFRPVMAVIEAFTAGRSSAAADGEEEENAGASSSAPETAFPRAPRRRRRVGLPPGYTPMGEVNIVDVEGPLSAILTVSQAMIR